MKALLLAVATTLISLSAFANTQDDLARLYATGVDAKLSDFPTLQDIAAGMRKPLQTVTDDGAKLVLGVFGTDKHFFVAATSLEDLKDVNQETVTADLSERQVSKYSFEEDHGQVVLSQKVYGKTMYTAFRVNNGVIIGKNFEISDQTPSIGFPPVLKEDTYSLFLKQ